MDVVRTLRAAGHRAYFAGGCVRDELLGRRPDDYDVATDATPDRLATLFRRTSQVGASFGVVLVKYGSPPAAGTVEVATFRADGSYTDRRRPDSVSFSDPQVDAQRRDFTVNALFLDPIDPPGASVHAQLPGNPTLTLAPSGGTIVDFVGGLADLEARVLRAVGVADQRLAEDHLRALRAVRLAAKLGFELDPSTAAAIRRHASELSGISRERIGDEIRLMMALPGRAGAIDRLHQLGLDAASLDEPQVESAANRALAGLPPSAALGTCLAAWAIDRGLGPLSSFRAEDRVTWHGVPSPAVISRCGHWRKALCLSNDERDAMVYTLQWTGLLTGHWSTLSHAHRRRTAGSVWMAPAMQLLASIGQTEAAIQTNYEQILAEVDHLKATGPGLNPVPLLSGDDLAKAGIPPGPRYRTLLELIYDAQLESRITTREQGLELARSLGV